MRQGPAAWHKQAGMGGDCLFDKKVVLFRQNLVYCFLMQAVESYGRHIKNQSEEKDECPLLKSENISASLGWKTGDEFPMSSATVELAAEAVGTEPARIAKTLSFKLRDKPILIVAAGDARVDNRRFMDTFNIKAKMLSADEAEEQIGHAVGGICPFAVKSGVPAYLDESLKRLRPCFRHAASSNSAIEVSIPELEKYSSNFAGWIDVC
jgi:prolyl-tRNA editing enzyme YbaK/EbsC (Cys-tRNA(Pro) deacylase)